MKKGLYIGAIALFLALMPVSVKASQVDTQQTETTVKADSVQNGIDQPIILLVSLSVVTAVALAVSTKKK